MKSAEVKDTILAGTFYEKMKSAWKGAEVKDTFLLGTFMKRKVVCISVPYEATCKCIFHDNCLTQFYLRITTGKESLPKTASSFLVDCTEMTQLT